MAYKIQLKHPSGGWFSVEADTYDNFYADLATVYGQHGADAVLAGLGQTTLPPLTTEGGAAPAAPTTAGDYFAGSPGPAAPPAPPSAPPASPAPPAPPAAPLESTLAWDSNPPHCVHGQRRSREWTPQSGRNAGKVQYTFFCPLPQDQKQNQCQPIDAVTGKEWGAR